MDHDTPISIFCKQSAPPFEGWGSRLEAGVSVAKLSLRQGSVGRVPVLPVVEGVRVGDRSHGVPEDVSIFVESGDRALHMDAHPDVHVDRERLAVVVRELHALELAGQDLPVVEPGRAPHGVEPDRSSDRVRLVVVALDLPVVGVGDAVQGDDLAVDLHREGGVGGDDRLEDGARSGEVPDEHEAGIADGRAGAAGPQVQAEPERLARIVVPLEGRGAREGVEDFRVGVVVRHTETGLDRVAVVPLVGLFDLGDLARRVVGLFDLGCRARSEERGEGDESESIDVGHGGLQWNAPKGRLK